MTSPQGRKNFTDLIIEGVLVDGGMEGGYLPWKNKRTEVVDQLRELEKPLPPPHPGKLWHHLDNGEWVLLDKPPEQDGNAALTTVAVNGYIEHTVMPDDTLQGICLRYNCSATDLRRMNTFSGNSIQFKKSLIIPVTPGAQVLPQLDKQDVLIQKFRNATGESVAEARIYLEDAGYMLDQALEEWKKDEQWEQSKYLDAVRADLTGASASVEEATTTQRTARFSTVVGTSSANGARTIQPVAVKVPREVAPVCIVELPVLPPTER